MRRAENAESRCPGASQSFLETETDKTESLQRFIQKVKQITELKVLTPELIHEFVDKMWCMHPDTLTVQTSAAFWTSITAASAFLHELDPGVEMWKKPSQHQPH